MRIFSIFPAVASDSRRCILLRSAAITIREELERGHRYGGEFIGISDSDALKIDIYQVFNDI